MEPSLILIKEAEYRRSLTKLRPSSHNLEIERGRHTKPVTLLSRYYVSSVMLLMNYIFATSCKSIQQSEKCIHMSILICQISAT